MRVFAEGDGHHIGLAGWLQTPLPLPPPLGLASAAACLQRQNAIRQDFMAGRLNVLLSTDVGAEGLDFRQCQLVAMMDPPASVTSLVQVRRPQHASRTCC